MGLIDVLFNISAAESSDKKCSQCHRRIKDHEKVYIRDGKVFCEKCAVEEDIWDELDLLDDIFDDEEW